MSDSSLCTEDHWFFIFTNLEKASADLYVFARETSFVLVLYKLSIRVDDFETKFGNYTVINYIEHGILKM